MWTERAKRTFWTNAARMAHRSYRATLTCGCNLGPLEQVGHLDNLRACPQCRTYGVCVSEVQEYGYSLDCSTCAQYVVLGPGRLRAQTLADRHDRAAGHRAHIVPTDDSLQSICKCDVRHKAKGLTG